MIKIIKILALSLAFIASADAAVYQNFAGGQPDDVWHLGDGGEHCVSIRSDGKWRDDSCFWRSKPFACYDGVNWAVTGDSQNLGSEPTGGKPHAKCQLLGKKFYFTAPFNAYENGRLTTLVQNSEAGEAWINIHDNDQENVFKSNTGFRFAEQPPYITRWAGSNEFSLDEPDGNDEDCGSMDKDGYWYDEPCDVEPENQKRYLCKNGGTWFISAAQGGSGRLYTAEVACRQDTKASSFSAPGSDTENESVRNTIRGGMANGERVWINFNDLLVEGDYQFNENQYFWNGGEPNGNISGSEECVVGLGSGLWNDTSCTGTRSYACYRQTTNSWNTASVSGSTEYNFEEGVKACHELDGASHQYTFWAPKDSDQASGGYSGLWLNLQWDTSANSWLENRGASHWGATIVSDKDEDGFVTNERSVREPNNGVFPAHAVQIPALNTASNEDCASQQANGTWYDLPCSGAMKFACYSAESSENGGWRLTGGQRNATIYSGENACQALTKDHQYHFIAPGSRQQLTDLAQLANRVGVWVNATDRTDEGKWRYSEFLTFWAGEGLDSIANPEQPEKDENKDCAIAKGSDSALWYAESCSETHEYLCKNGESWVLAGANSIGGASPLSGQEACNSIGLFLAPNSLAEQKAVAAFIGIKDVWINASDVQIEETWKINELQFWDQNEPTSAGDCAIMQKSEPSPKVDGLWASDNCKGVDRKFLCLDTTNGEWVESIEVGNMEHFGNGQNACEAMNRIIDGKTHEFIFAAPNYTWENDAARNTIGNASVWINGNDRIDSDVWVFNEFLYWSGNALKTPDNETNDCLVINGSGHWIDAACDGGPHQVACFSGDGWYLSPESINVSNFSDAQRACNEIGVGYRFFSPISAADNRDLRGLVGGKTVWINGIDIAEEGTWVFNSTGLPTPNWASSEPSGKTSKNCTFVDSNGLWYADECSGAGSESRKATCLNESGDIGLTTNTLMLTSNFDVAHDECVQTFGVGSKFYAPITFNENEELRQMLSPDDEVWVNGSDNYTEARWALNIAPLADYSAVINSVGTDVTSSAGIDGCVSYDDAGVVSATSCLENRAVVCGNGYEWKISNGKVALGTADDNGALIRNAFGMCQQEFSGDYTFAVPSNTDSESKWELSQALALSGKVSAWVNMADWFLKTQFSSNMPYQNIANTPAQPGTGCAYSDGITDGWLVAEVCDSIAAHFACFNGSDWKIAPANGTIENPAKPQDYIDAWDQSYGDLRCREYFGQSYNFSAPITPSEDTRLKQAINRLDNADKKTWINYYSNRLWDGLNGQQWFADRINLNIVDDVELDQGATTEDCASISYLEVENTGIYKYYLRDEVCSNVKNALCFDGTTWSKTTTPTQWNKASAQCGLELGEQHVFAIPRDSLERSFVEDLFTEDESLWVNYSDLSVENKWRANIPVRQWWADSEPTNRGNRDCVVMGGVGSGMTPGEWRSDYCDQVFHQYACKRGTAWRVVGLDGQASSEGGIWAQGFSSCKKIPDDGNGTWHFDFPEDYFANLAAATTIAAGTGDDKDFDNQDTVLTSELTNTTAWLNLTDQYREKDWQRGRQFNDWAAKFAFDDNKDCAFVDTVADSVGGQAVKGSWQPGLCFASDTPRQYACSNGLNWAVADAVSPATGNNWIDGFAACEELQPAGSWVFSAPVTSFDNERLKAAVGKGSVWINLQDVGTDGDWAANLSKPNLPPIIKFAAVNNGAKINEISVAEQTAGHSINIEVIDPESSVSLTVVVTEESGNATITSTDTLTEICNLNCNFSFTYTASTAINTVKKTNFKIVATDDAGLTTTTYFNSDVIPAIIAWYDFNDANRPNFDKTGNGNDANDVPELPYDFPPVKDGAIDFSSGDEKMTVDGGVTKLNLPKDYAVALRIWSQANDESEYQDFQIKFSGQEQCLDLPGTGSTAAQVGNSVSIYACGDQSDQHWYYDENTKLIHSVANNDVCLSHPDGAVSGSRIKLSYCSNVNHGWTITNGEIQSVVNPSLFIYADSFTNDEPVVLSSTATKWSINKNYGRGVLQKGPVANQPLLTLGDKTSYLTYTVGEDSGTTAEALKEEQWVNLVVNVEGTELTLFVDGIKEPPVTLTTAAVANNDDLIIGDIPSALRSFIGRIDDVQVFSRPLTDAEVIEVLPEPPIGIVQFESASIVRQEPQVENGSLASPIVVRRTDGSRGQLRARYKTVEKSANEGDDYIGLLGNEPTNLLVWQSDNDPLYLSPEYDLLPLISSLPLENIDSVELARTQPVFVAIDLSIPAEPKGVVWEQGGSGRGVMVGFNENYELVVRAGSGALLPNNDTARLVKSKQYVQNNLVGKTGTLFVEINPAANRHSIQAWFKEGGLFGESKVLSLGANASSNPFPSNEWQGGDPGMLGNRNSSLVLSEYSTVKPFKAQYIRNTVSGSVGSGFGGAHWVEIQAFDAAGNTNIAQGKTAITASDSFHTESWAQPKEAITDGVVDSGQYVAVVGADNTPRWVQIDLGEIYSLSSVNVRHYYDDSRVYDNNITEYSEDGSVWSTLADFTASPYAETAAGRSMDLGAETPSFLYNGTITMARFYNQLAPNPLERVVENAKLAKVVLLNEAGFDREPTERFDVELVSAEHQATSGGTWDAHPEGTTGYLKQTEVKLLDYTKNPHGILQFSQDTYQCSEPYAGAGNNSGSKDYGDGIRFYRNCSVEVQRLTGDQDIITVEYGISPRRMSHVFTEADVKPGTDLLFPTTDHKLTFATGVRTQSINFTVIAEIGAENLYESNEDFTLTLFNPVNTEGGDAPWLGDPTQATVVSDDYAVGVIEMVNSEVSFEEPLASEAISHIRTVNVRRASGTNGISMVDVTLTADNIQSSDYDLVDAAGTVLSSQPRLTWGEGDDQPLPIFIKIYSDKYQEVIPRASGADCYADDDQNRDCSTGESLLLTLSNVSGSAASVSSTKNTTRVYVQDNTAPAVVRFTDATMNLSSMSEVVTANTVDVDGSGTFNGGDTVSDNSVEVSIQRSNQFSEHAVWLYIRGVQDGAAIPADFIGVNSAESPKDNRSRDDHDAWLENDLIRDGRVPGEYRYLWVLPKGNSSTGTNTNIASLATLSTDIDTWYFNGGNVIESGTPGISASQLAAITDGNTSVGDPGDYQVHPQLADNKSIVFAWSDIYLGGNVKIYNRTGCCGDRIDGSQLEFSLGGEVMHQSVINSSASEITMTIPDGVQFDRIELIFSGDSQNFREIEVNSKLPIDQPAVHKININIYDNARTDAQNRNLEFSIEAASIRDARVIDLGEEGSNAAADFADVQITDENLPPEFNSATTNDFLWPMSFGGGMSITSIGQRELSSITGLDRDWLNVRYTTKAIDSNVVIDNQVHPHYNLLNLSSSGNRSESINGTSTTLTNDSIWGAPYIQSVHGSLPVPTRQVKITSIENGTEKNLSVDKVISINFRPNWYRIVIATDNECMFKDGGGVTWGWGGIRNCDGSDEMYWAVIPQGTTPQTYQLINKSGGQCLYKNSGNGDPGFRNCQGGAAEQWILTGSTPALRKRDAGTSGTERYVCGAIGGGVSVRSSCGVGWWDNTRWRP